MGLTHVAIPLAGGVQFGTKEVKYYDATTPVNYTEENVTPQSLAYRDYLIGEKVDEVVDYLNGLVSVPLGFSNLEGPALNIRENTPSGFVTTSGLVKEIGEHTKSDLLVPSSSESSADYYDSIAHPVGQEFIINGYKLLWFSEALSNTGIIRLPPAPASGVRQDLVFIEAWIEEVSPSSPIFYPYGCVDGTSPVTSDPTEASVASTLGMKPDGTFLQLRYRTRVVSGVDFKNNMYRPIGDSTTVFAQGHNTTPTTFPFTDSIDDNGIYYAYDSSLSYNGYVYAIPVAVIHRRNQSAWTIDNVNGTKDGSAGGTWVTGESGRPDMLYHDKTEKRDVFDLRHRVTTGKHEYDEIFERTMEELSRGLLATRWESLQEDPAGSGTFTDIDIFGGVMTDSFGIKGLCGFESGNQVRCITSSPNGTSTLADGIRMVWADSSEDQAIMFYIKDESADGIEPLTVFSYTTSTHVIAVTLTDMESNDGSNPYRPQLNGTTPTLIWEDGTPVNVVWGALSGDSVTGTVQAGDSGGSEGYTAHPGETMLGEIYITFNLGSGILDKSPLSEGYTFISLKSGEDQLEVTPRAGLINLRPVDGDEQTRKLSTFGFISKDRISEESAISVCTLFYNNLYNMFILNEDGKIYKATSEDGVVFGTLTEVLNPYSDIGSTNPSSLTITENATALVMYLNAYATSNVYRFDSSDGGDTWTKVTCPGTNGSIVRDTYYPYNKVIWDSVDKYKMYYTPGPFANYIAVATSSDGQTFSTASATAVNVAPMGVFVRSFVVMKEEDALNGDLYRLWACTYNAVTPSAADTKMVYAVSKNGINFLCSQIARVAKDEYIDAYTDGKNSSANRTRNIIQSILKVNSGYYAYYINWKLNKDVSPNYNNYGIKYGVMGLMDKDGSGSSPSGVYTHREEGKIDHTLSTSDSMLIWAQVSPRQIATDYIYGTSSEASLKYVIKYTPERPVVLSSLGSGYKSPKLEYKEAHSMLPQIAWVGDEDYVNTLYPKVIPTEYLPYDLFMFLSTTMLTYDGFGQGDIDDQYPGQCQKSLRYYIGKSNGVNSSLLPSNNCIKEKVVSLPLQPGQLYNVKIVKGAYAIETPDIYSPYSYSDLSVFGATGKSESVLWNSTSSAVLSLVCAIAQQYESGKIFMPISQSITNTAEANVGGSKYHIAVIPVGRPLAKW